MKKKVETLTGARLDRLMLRKAHIWVRTRAGVSKKKIARLFIECYG